MLASVNKIAQDLGCTRQNLAKMLKRHDEAPQPVEGGLYDVEEVKGFYYSRTHEDATTRELKERILEQKYRIAKAKADEAERLVIPKNLVIDLFRDADIVLENVMTDFARDCVKANPSLTVEELIEKAKPHFKRWRDFLMGLNGKK